MISDRTLDHAVTEGLLPTAQAARLRALEAETAVAPAPFFTRMWRVALSISLRFIPAGLARRLPNPRVAAA
jgi:hypothetical protein